MGLSVSEAIEVGSQLVEMNRPFLAHGKPGCGKTDAGKQIAKRTGRKLYLSQPTIDDPTDYKGLPFISEGVARFFPLGMIDKILQETEPSLWLIDDLGQAIVAVQNAIMQFVHYRNRELNGMRVPDCVSIMACTNGRDHNAGVTGLTDPLKNRFITMFEVDVSIDSWIEWACNNNINPITIAYLQYRPANLCTFTQNRDFDAQATPRSWESVSDLLRLNVNEELLSTVIQGAVGEHVGTEFMGFKRIHDQLPNLDMIQANPEQVPVPSDAQACYALTGALSVRGTEEHTLTNITKYVGRLPAEFQVLWSEVWSKRNKNLTNLPAWTKWCVEKSDILAI